MYIKIEGDGGIIFKLNIDWIKNSADNYLKWKWLLCSVYWHVWWEKSRLISQKWREIRNKEIRRTFMPKTMH